MPRNPEKPKQEKGGEKIRIDDREIPVTHEDIDLKEFTRRLNEERPAQAEKGAGVEKEAEEGLEELKRKEYEEAELETVRPYPEDVEKEKSEAREEVEKAFTGPAERVEKTSSAREYFKQELPKRLDEKERGLEMLISEKQAEKEEAGKKLSRGEIARLTSDYYLRELDCEKRIKGSLFGKPLKVYDKEKGAFLMNEKGKPLSFGSYGEMNKYLREEKLINDELDGLRQEWKTGKPPEKEPENFNQYLEQNLDKAFQEKKEEIDKMVEEEYLVRQSRGDKFTPEQRYAFEQRKYLEVLQYDIQRIQTKFGFGEKARIITDSKKGTPLLNEKGRPLEIPKGFFWYGSYRINAILKEQLKEKTKNGLREQWEKGSKKEEKPEGAEQPKTREELREDLAAMIGSERMKKLDDLEKQLSKGEISKEEYWEKDRAVIDEAVAELKKGKSQEEGEERPSEKKEEVKSERKEEETEGGKKYKLVLTEGTQWMRDRGLDPLFKAFGEKAFTKEEAINCLWKYKRWATGEEAEENFQDLVANGYVAEEKKAVEEKPQQAEEKKEEKVEKIDWLEQGREGMRKKNIPTQITGKLEKYLRKHRITKNEIRRMKPVDAWERAIEIYEKEQGESE